MFIALAFGAKAEAFPNLPIKPSERILTSQEVKNGWVNATRALPIPSKPTGLHPKAQAEWRNGLERRKAFILAVESGVHDKRAEVIALEHNIGAWRLRGEEAKAVETEERLRELLEHHARLETLELQRRAALAQITTAERLRAVEAELSALRSSCTHACCRN